MKYDLKKELKDKSAIALQWHGDDTKVSIYGKPGKTEVKKGDVIKVNLKQARELLSYSYLWTLEGDEPVKHGYDEMMAKLGAKQAAQGEEDGDAEEVVDINDVDKMKKPAIITALKKIGATFNDQSTAKELALLLKDAIAAKNAPEVKEGDETDKGIAHYVTEDDLKNNPDLAAQDVKVGDLIYLPAAQGEEGK